MPKGKPKAYQNFIFVFRKCLSQVLYIAHDFLVHFFPTSKTYAAGINSIAIFNTVNYKISLIREDNRELRCMK